MSNDVTHIFEIAEQIARAPRTGSYTVLYKHSRTSCQGGLPGRVVLLVRREETENEKLQNDPAERALLEILRPGDSRLFRRARHRNLDHFVDRDPAVPAKPSPSHATS